MIGIIGAMEEEVAELKKDMQIDETIEQAGMVFCKGSLGGKDVVIVRSGIGKVNAGICAQILVDRFDVDTLINTGIAGSLDAQIDIGDMVISTDALHHDMDATIFGDPAGQIPRMDTLSFPADEKLVKKAVAANEKANPDIRGLYAFINREFAKICTTRYINREEDLGFENLRKAKLSYYPDLLIEKSILILI